MIDICPHFLLFLWLFYWESKRWKTDELRELPVLSLCPKLLHWLCLGLSLSGFVPQYWLLSPILDGSFPETKASFDSQFFVSYCSKPSLNRFFFFNYSESINRLSRIPNFAISSSISIAQIYTEQSLWDFSMQFSLNSLG